MKIESLSRNKGAMLALKYMAKYGLSDREISRKLYDTYGHLWGVNTISRGRRKEGILRESPFSSTTITTTTKQRKHDFEKKAANFKFSNDIPPPVYEHLTSIATINPPQVKTDIEEHFKNVNQDNLSFGDLCQYTASFFEPIANYPLKQSAPQEWWDIAKDKAICWDSVRERTSMDFSEFTRSQIYAYDYCMAMYTQLIVGGRNRGRKGRYRKVYALYREWRAHFLAVNKEE